MPKTTIIILGLILAFIFISENIWSYISSGYHKNIFGISYRYIEYPAYKRKAIKLAQADRASFEVISIFPKVNSPYAKDKQCLYFKGRAIKKVDPAKIEIFNREQVLLYDGFHYIHKGKIISNDDLNFKIINREIWKDRDKEWKLGFLISKGKD